MLKKFKYTVCILSFVFTNNTINAQKDSLLFKQQKGECCGYCTDGDHLNKSPYTINVKNEIPYFATGIGLLGSGLIVREFNGESPFTLQELSLLNPNDVNSFDRGATNNNSSLARKASDVILISGAAFPLLFLSNHHTKKDFFPLLVMATEIYTITGGITLNTKFLFNRPRPLAYNPDFSNELRTDQTSKLSFISGHTAQTAALSVFIAKVIHDYHPNHKTGLKIGVWTLALALPAVTGALRVKGGKHFNTDVITGFAVGAAVGWLVPHLHKTKKESKFSMGFYNREEVNGLSLIWKL